MQKHYIDLKKIDAYTQLRNSIHEHVSQGRSESLYRTETSTNLPNHYELDEKYSWKTTLFQSGKSSKKSELRSRPCILTNVVTKVNYKIAFDSDPTKTQVVHRNHLKEYAPCDKELPNQLCHY